MMTPDEAAQMARDEKIKRSLTSKARLNAVSGCWEWAHAKDKWGYGNVYVGGGKIEKAHRASYKAFIGEIPPGLLVCHHCDNPKCINPEHLFLGTDKDNAMDRADKGRGGNLRGERNGRSKLCAEDIAIIRAEHYGNIARRKDLAKRFRVNKSTIDRIINGQRWRDPAPSTPTVGGEMVRKMLDEIGPEPGGEGGNETAVET